MIPKHQLREQIAELEAENKELKAQIELAIKVLSMEEYRGEYSSFFKNVFVNANREEGTITFDVNCSDLFWWGTADGEEITLENFHMIREAIVDVAEALGVTHDRDDYYGFPKNRDEMSKEEREKDWKDWDKVSVDAATLFACRVRNMRPQGACYKSYDERLWPLLDACGPPRETDIMNPVAQEASSE